MSVAVVDRLIHLSGAARLEDAEPLVALLQDGRCDAVDLSAAEALHTSVLQALLAFRPAVRGRPRDVFVETWLLPLLQGPGNPVVGHGGAVAEQSGAGEAASPPQSPPEQT